MKRVNLPGTDLCASRLSFGTASLHHLPASAKRQRLLAAAVGLGFSHFDLSPCYGFGISEWETGRFLRHRPEVTVASKVGLYPPSGRTSSTLSAWTRKGLGKLAPSLSAPVVDWSVAAAEKSLEQTLRTLGRDCLDILFLHEPAPGLLDADEFRGWLTRQRDAGKIRYWGLAGPLERFAPWVQAGHPLAQVLQVRDAADGSGASQLREARREPQITYGSLSSARGAGCGLSPVNVLKAALERNPRGWVIVSTRRVSHLRELAAAAE